MTDMLLYFAPGSCSRVPLIALLETGANFDTSLVRFRKGEHKSSAYKMSKDELNYTEWTPVILRKHQDKMAKWACSAWKSYFISK